MNHPQHNQDVHEQSGLPQDVVTSYRLMSHLDDHKSLALAVTRPNLCFDLFSIVIDSQTGDALVERLQESPAASNATVVQLCGAPLFDVTHIRPGAEFVIAGEKFTYMRPLDLLITDSKPDQARRLTALMSDRERLGPFAVLLAAQQEAHDDGARLALEAAPDSASALRRFPMRTPTVLVSLLAAAGLLTLSVTLGFWARPGVSVSETAPEPVIAPQVETSAPETVRPLSEGNGEGNSEGKGEGNGEAPLESVTAGAKRTAAVTPPKTSGTPATSKDQTASPNQDKNLTPAQRESVAEYVLESRFDPDGALRKLEELKKNFPAGSQGQLEIQRKINTIR